jgi:hypothetical protein
MTKGFTPAMTSRGAVAFLHQQQKTKRIFVFVQ